ncbi:MAG: uroporphyrinogen decarboxylase family protein [Planctomycetota bacterium]|nr:uroporphyrinogen decarboxylase family protein [Planctomycetota bacterium]MDP7130298.1 uroporphyrinogen decarboxylase family protein [Planctomycetota bacterium]MDP7250656.1 uroporphyrinogen decarboxylase family protein [Planctomycetota bacterium]
MQRQNSPATSWAVIEDLIRNRSAPRMGLRENIWGQTLAKWVGEGYPTDSEGKPVDPCVHFDHDWAGVGGGFDLWPLRGYREVVEETDQWQIVRNGSGAELRHWKHRAGTPEHIRFHMSSRQVWEEEYRPYLLELDRDRLRLEAARRGLALRREQGKWAIFGSMFIFEHMRQSLGDFCMYESFLADPEWIRDYCNVVTDFYIAHARVTLEEAGRPDGIRICEDLGYKERLLVSPKCLEEFVFPCYRKLVDFFHSYNVPVLLHSCGCVTEALPMILEAGFDALDPMERAAGCDPREFAERADGNLVLIGGFDKRILESGDRKAIRHGVTELLGFMRQNRVPYIFSTDHSISTNVAYRDYQYMVDVYRDNAAY